jgi:hypothetical protein
MGTLTRTEWIQFMTVHTVRHVHQLKRIIAALWDKVQTLKNKFQTTMDIHSISKAAKYNPVLEPLHVLIGEWKTTGKHPMMPGKVLEGHASFKWIEGGAFMIMHAYVKEKEFPEGIAIFGGDSSSEEYSMIYYDEREIARKYTSTLKDNVWNWWRNDAEFSQRFIGNISEDTNTIVLKGEMSKNGEPWEGDLELTYNRVH